MGSGAVSDVRSTPPTRWVAQHIEVSGGTAYGAVDGDIHVFGDGGVIYLLTQEPAVCSTSADVDPVALGDLQTWRSDCHHLALRWLQARHLPAATDLAATFAADSAAAGWLVVHAVHKPRSSPEPGSDHGPRPTARGEAGTLLVVTGADHWPHSHIAWLFSNRILFQEAPARILLVATSGARWPAIRASIANIRAATSSQHLGGLWSAR
jgi:hypothetical protein